MAIKQHIYLIFSPQFFIYFFNGVYLFKTTYRWPRTISFLTISWFEYWNACNILRVECWVQKMVVLADNTIFVPSAFNHCQMVLSFAKLCLLSFFSPFDGDYQNKNPLFFSTKSWTELNNLWRNSTDTPINNIRTYLFTLPQ